MKCIEVSHVVSCTNVHYFAHGTTAGCLFVVIVVVVGGKCVFPDWLISSARRLLALTG